MATIAITFGWRLLNTTPAHEIASVAFSKGDVLINSTRITDNAKQVVREGDRLSTGERSGARLELNNALSVRLAPNSNVRWKTAGEVELLSGSLYVDSGPKHAPLAVSTRFGVVSHLGTRYRIRANDYDLTVAVRDGRVEVTNANGKISGDAGQEFRVGKNGQIARNMSSPFGEEWAWVDALAPQFDIERRSLVEFLNWAASETGRTVEFADENTAKAALKTILHGSSASLTPSEAIEAIVPTTDFAARYDGQKLVVSAH